MKNDFILSQKLTFSLEIFLLVCSRLFPFLAIADFKEVDSL